MGLGRPNLDASQSYTLDSAAEQNGITSLRFRRARDTNDMRDIQFNVGSFSRQWVLSGVNEKLKRTLFSEGLRERSQPPSQDFSSKICQGKGKGSGNEAAGKREVEFCDDRKV